MQNTAVQSDAKKQIDDAMQTYKATVNALIGKLKKEESTKRLETIRENLKEV